MKIQTTEAVRRFNDAVFAGDLVTDMQFDTASPERLAKALEMKGRPMISIEIQIATKRLKDSQRRAGGEV